MIYKMLQQSKAKGAKEAIANEPLRIGFTVPTNPSGRVFLKEGDLLERFFMKCIRKVK